MNSGWRQGRFRSAPAHAAAPGPLVIKVGGSLLSRPAWSASIATLAELLPAPRLLVVGGGQIVDALRAVDAACPQPAAVMHELAVDAMGLTARLVAAALGVPVVSGPSPDLSTAVLDAPAWLREDGRMRQLPVGWHVTSDSIAACVAARHGGRLLLAKSMPPPCSDDDPAALAAAGWVDEHFPTASRSLASIAWAAPA